MKTECHELASKIRASIAAQNKLSADRESIQRQQADEQKTVDELIAEGAIDDEKAVSRVASAQSQLLFFPAKLRQIEASLAALRESLAVDFLSAQTLLGRAATLVEKRLIADVQKMLTPLISDRQGRETLTLQVVNASDALAQTYRAVTNYYDDQVKSADSEQLRRMATTAASRLEAVS